MKIKEWDKKAVYEIFKELKFKRYIDRFNLEGEITSDKSAKELSDLFKLEELSISEDKTRIETVLNMIKNQKSMIFYLYKTDDKTSENIIKKKVKSISIYDKENQIVYYVKITNEDFVAYFKEMFESSEIKKYGYKLNEDYVLMLELGIQASNIFYDAELAAYVINPTNKYTLNDLSMEYLGLDINEFVEKENENKDFVAGQLNFFEQVQEKRK